MSPAGAGQLGVQVAVGHLPVGEKVESFWALALNLSLKLFPPSRIIKFLGEEEAELKMPGQFDARGASQASCLEVGADRALSLTSPPCSQLPRLPLRCISNTRPYWPNMESPDAPPRAPAHERCSTRVQLHSGWSSLAGSFFAQGGGG